MSAAELLFSQPPLVGAPALVFGDSDAPPVIPVVPIDPRALVFQTLVTDVADIRALVFGADADVVPPVSIATVTVQASGKITGLRGHITLRTVAVVQAAGQISGLRGHLTIRTVAVLGGAGRISGLRGSMEMQYLINVERPTVGQASAHWRRRGGCRHPHERHRRLRLLRLRAQRRPAVDARARDEGTAL